MKILSHTSHKIQSNSIEPKPEFSVFEGVHTVLRGKIFIFHNQRVHATTLSIICKEREEI